MGFVEAVATEFFHQTEDWCSLLGSNSILDGSVYKALPVLGHD